MSRIILFLFPVLVFVLSCKKQDIAVTGPGYEDVKNFNVQEVDFEYFASRSKIRYETDEQSLSFTANIRMKRDSAIWMSMTPGLGVEVARVLLTKDSVRVLDRMNKEYYARDYSFFAEKFNTTVNFDILQGILLGNLPLAKEPGNKLLTDKKADFLVLEQFLSNVKLESFVKKNTMKVEELILSEQGTEKNVEIAYTNFKALDEQTLFPTEMNINADLGAEPGDQAKIRIEHAKPEKMDEMDFDFTIPVPDRYEVK